MGVISAPQSARLDLAGIGAGPSNLSLAALLRRAPELTARFYDRRAHFVWHPGLLLPESPLQVSWLKDLVTLADPTHPLSYLNFLFEHKRLYQAVHSQRGRPPRLEVDEYLRWVGRRLPNVAYGRGVAEVRWTGAGFSLQFDDGAAPVEARHICIGVGVAPQLPAWAMTLLGPTLMHAERFLTQPQDYAGRVVAIIGGGQTGAELAANLLNRDAAERPREILWLSRRPNLLPIDDSPYVNELFSPAYARHFGGLPAQRRAGLLEEQRLASDGVSMDLLFQLYRRIYDLELVEEKRRICRIGLGQHVLGAEAVDQGWRLTLEEDGTGVRREAMAERVILCTGFQPAVPDCLAPIRDRLDLTDLDAYRLRPDFSVAWDGPTSHKIFVQNAARHKIGVADPNLSLLAWRSALIVNSLAERTLYDVEQACSAIDWSQDEIGVRCDQREAVYA